MEQHYIRQRDYLLEISRALTSELSLNEVLRIILRSATDILGGQAGLIALTGKTGLTVRASIGIESRALGFFATLLKEMPAAMLNETEAQEKLGQQMRVVAQTARIGMFEVISLPLKVADETVGVLFIFRPSGITFTGNDVRLLQSFVDQAAIAVHNARLYEQVTTEKQRFEALLQHSADGIMVLTAASLVDSVNLALRTILGIDPDSDVTGFHHDALICWAQREPGSDLTDSIANGWPGEDGEALYVEGDLLRESGSRISVGITYAPLFNARNELQNIIANVRDITRFREAERAKDTFMSMMSHELKTPVSIIKGYTETLRREDVEWDLNTITKSLDVIIEETDKLTEMIENLLDVSRVHAGMLKIHPSPTHVDKLIERLVEKFQIGTPGHKLTVQFPPEFPAVLGDDQRLRQIFSNLLGNAIKYSPNGGTIEVKGYLDGCWACISVSDEGIGIAPEQQAMIFDPFYRVDNGMTRETPGVGLGLYIVKSLVETHGGEILLKSSPAEGTNFIVKLPLAEAVS
jgi:PAS domain S-box-containing protein